MVQNQTSGINFEAMALMTSKSQTIEPIFLSKKKDINWQRKSLWKKDKFKL
jgi:hypothetical protein